MKLTVMKVGWLLFLILAAGCSATKVAGLWRDRGIVPDGDDREWRIEPQYADKDRQLDIRVINDAMGISLCLAAGGQDIVRRLREDGLTIWFDPRGAEQHAFGIHLPGGRPEPFQPGMVVGIGILIGESGQAGPGPGMPGGPMGADGLEGGPGGPGPGGRGGGAPGGRG